MDKNAITIFRNKLMHWNKYHNRRIMPWKGQKDPYKIWLSEIILQQTRVEQGWNYYNRFVEQFPTIKTLASAPEQKVYKLWEGLGYYSRCKNLLATAKKIVAEYNGVFPNQYESILNLKGIGAYTAAAIASFAYNMPYAVVDGNVSRVLSRFFAYENLIDSTEGKKHIASLANQCLHRNHPGLYNQAIMDFGAVICKPQNPLCTDCVLKKDCLAFQLQKVNLLPKKEKKIVKHTRKIWFLIFEKKDTVYIRQRLQKDIWQNLFEFYSYESTSLANASSVFNVSEIKKIMKGRKPLSFEVSKPFKQILSHQLVQARFIHIKLALKPGLPKEFLAIKKTQLQQFAFPKIINEFLIQKSLNKQPI